MPKKKKQGKKLGARKKPETEAEKLAAEVENKRKLLDKYYPEEAAARRRAREELIARSVARGRRLEREEWVRKERVRRVMSAREKRMSEVMPKKKKKQTKKKSAKRSKPLTEAQKAAAHAKEKKRTPPGDRVAW